MRKKVIHFASACIRVHIYDIYIFGVCEREHMVDHSPLCVSAAGRRAACVLGDCLTLPRSLCPSVSVDLMGDTVRMLGGREGTEQLTWDRTHLLSATTQCHQSCHHTAHHTTQHPATAGCTRLLKPQFSQSLSNLAQMHDSG